MRVAQAVPVIVGPPDEIGLHPLIAGGRRLAAAHLIESEDAGLFYLECIVRPAGRDYLFDAIRENMKRRGLTALQFAHLCKELREERKWSGTAEVAKYLGVSRAQVSQHDKLLKRPAGMSKAAYDELIALVQAGRAGAETAFYTLTHVEPEAAGQVLNRAQELAEADEAKRDAEPAARAPRSGKRQQSASGTTTVPPLGQPEASGNRAEPPKPKARVEKKHVRQAAQESRAIKEPTQRTVPELRALFEKLRDASYPDIMRNFISILAGKWWAGVDGDKEVIAHWTQIALLVEESLERSSKRGPAQHPYGKRTATTATKVKQTKVPAKPKRKVVASRS